MGTLIDQNQSPDWYAQHYPDLPGKALGFLDYKLIRVLQWDHVYTADYFLALLVTLAASLAACTTTRQWPMLKVACRYVLACSAPNLLQGMLEVPTAGSHRVLHPQVALC